MNMRVMVFFCILFISAISLTQELMEQQNASFSRLAGEISYLPLPFDCRYENRKKEYNDVRQAGINRTEEAFREFFVFISRNERTSKELQGYYELINDKRKKFVSGDCEYDSLFKKMLTTLFGIYQMVRCQEVVGERYNFIQESAGVSDKMRMLPRQTLSKSMVTLIIQYLGNTMHGDDIEKIDRSLSAVGKVSYYTTVNRVKFRIKEFLLRHGYYD